MNILLFGENCTGKSTIASLLETENKYKVISGKDYLRLAKNPSEALTIFKNKLANSEENIIFVSAEKDQVAFVPDNVLKVLFTAELDIIKERFSIRFRGNLPKSVEQMLERKHGMFDSYNYDLKFSHNDRQDEIVKAILNHKK